MTVNVSKPAINVRSKLAELDKPTGIAGEAMLRAETPQEQFNLIGAGRRNILINGDFQVSQRGDYSSATTVANNLYYLDRWKTATNTTKTIQRTTDVPTGQPFRYSMKLNIATGGSNLYHTVQQFVEDYERLAGQTVTLSAWVKSNTQESCIVIFDGVSWKGAKGHSGSGEWEYLTTTLTLSSSLTQLRIRVGLVDLAQTGISAPVDGTYMQITGVQLELGKVATPFEHRSYGEELALCQRYFYRYTGATDDRWGVYYSGSGNTQSDYLSFPVTMRVTPTGTVVSNGLLRVRSLDDGLSGDITPSTLSCQGITKDKWRVSVNAVLANAAQILAFSSVLNFDAEL